jgi:hypothetical protein
MAIVLFFGFGVDGNGYGTVIQKIDFHIGTKNSTFYFLSS